MRVCPVHAIALVASVLTAGCNEADLTSIRIDLESDGSGRIIVSAVDAPEAAGAAEQAAGGVQWTQRVRLDAAVGRFESLDDLSFEDLRFEAGLDGDDAGTLTITIPRGPGVTWTRRLAPPAAKQADAAAAFDPSGKTAKLGRDVRISLTLPGDVISSASLPYVRGVTTSDRGSDTSITLPATQPDVDADSIVWVVSWQKGS